MPKFPLALPTQPVIGRSAEMIPLPPPSAGEAMKLIFPSCRAREIGGCGKETDFNLTSRDGEGVVLVLRAADRQEVDR